MSLDFSKIKFSKTVVEEYQEQKISGRVIRLKAFDENFWDVHERVLRTIDSFSNFIDREDRKRENELLQSINEFTLDSYRTKINKPIVIEFKSYNFAIINLFTDALYGLTSLKNQPFIDLLDLALFVDWMGKSELDDSLLEMKKICFEAMNFKLLRSLDSLSKEDLALILVLSGNYIA